MLPRIYRTEPDIRKHQINTLKVFNDNVSEITEGSEYQIPFKSGRNELCLHISLSNNFPKEKPILKIIPSIIHQWINSEGEVTSAPGLLNFTVHSDLGRVVQAIIREFERTPPPLSDCSSNITSPTTMSIKDERLSPKYFQTVNNFSPPLPIQQRLIPELNNLSLEELEFLNNNVDRQFEFLNEMQPIKEQNRMLDDLILHVEELAESNLSKQDELKELKCGIGQRIEEVTKLAFENERLYVKYQSLSDKYSPANIREELRLAAQQADLESEKIADSFLLGEVDVDKFISHYIQNRTLSQLRKTKDEKLSQQLVSLEKAGF